jgi:outer membrane protein OmpA-like peptidoglycan-associated protein
MAFPNDRAAGPGTQTVRVDNIKEKSWLEADSDTCKGQIFFTTDVYHLSPEDEALIDEVAKKYASDMLLNPTAKYKFIFAGYCDHRNGESYNKELSERRAEAVENRFRHTLGLSPNYDGEQQAHGIDENDPRTSADSSTLAKYRRTNIVGPGLRGQPPPPPPPPPPEKPKPKRSNRFKARMKTHGSAGYLAYVGDLFLVDIVDLENNLTQEFIYKGMGFGKSRATFGYTYSKTPTEWVFFTTNPDVELWEMEGFAFHSAVQAKIPIASFTGDMLTLTLAHSKRSPDWVYLKFKKWAILKGGTAISGSQTGGTLEPHGPVRPWDGKDP